MEEEKMTADSKKRYICYKDEVLGAGSYGKVYKGFDQFLKRPLAVKVISLEGFRQGGLKEEQLVREINLMSEYKPHENLVSFIRCTRTANNVYVYLEYCTDGDLDKFLKEKPEKKISEPEVRELFRQVLEGMKALRNSSTDIIIHRDLKPGNILRSGSVWKIADFGMARKIDESIDQKATTKLGSPLFVTPEIWKGKDYGSKCDIWSLGVIMYRCLYGRYHVTADNQEELRQKILSNQVNYPEDAKISKELIGLLKQMLQVDEEKRISWEALFAFDWRGNTAPSRTPSAAPTYNKPYEAYVPDPQPAQTGGPNAPLLRQEEGKKCPCSLM